MDHVGSFRVMVERILFVINGVETISFNLILAIATHDPTYKGHDFKCLKVYGVDNYNAED